MGEIDDRLDRLESQVEAHRATIEDQKEVIEYQRKRISELEADHKAGHERDDTTSALNRRTALKAGGVLALLFGGIGTASADSRGQVGTGSDPLQALYTDELNGGITDEDGNTDQAVTSIVGDGLTILNEALTAELAQVNTGTGVLTGVGTDGITHRSLSEGPGVSVSASNETITLGLTDELAVTDVATTFMEPDLTISHDGTAISNGGLEPRKSIATSLSLGNEADLNPDEWRGITINPNRTISEFELELALGSSGVRRLRVLDNSGDELLRNDIGHKTDGELVEVSGIDFDAGKTYHIQVTNEKVLWDSRYEPDGNMPDTEFFDVTGGSEGSAQSTTDHWSFRSVTGRKPSDSGTARVEWADSDAVRWDSASVRVTPDGGTVEVYVETSDDGGSSWSDWSGNPSDGIGPATDISSIPGADDVRFRVEFTYTSPSENPRLEAIGRRGWF